jgi:hypothetical protein
MAKRDGALDMLPDLDGQSFAISDQGYFVKFVVKRSPVWQPKH